jgi:hypothetical protein
MHSNGQFAELANEKEIEIQKSAPRIYAPD